MWTTRSVHSRFYLIALLGNTPTTPIWNLIMKTFTVNEKSTKREILEGCEDYISYMEETMCHKSHIRNLVLVAFVIGVMSGLGI